MMFPGGPRHAWGGPRSSRSLSSRRSVLGDAGLLLPGPREHHAGWSEAGAEGAPLYDAGSIAAFAAELEAHLPVRRVDDAIDGPAAASAVVGVMEEPWSQRSPSRA